MIPCICIDDSGRPAIIPEDKWLKNGQKYHIVDIRAMMRQGGILAVQLHELDLSDIENSEYHYFRMVRFLVMIEDLPKVKQMIVESAQLAALDGVDMLQLIENSTNS